MLRLHHEPEKMAFYRNCAPVEWSEELHSWCIFDPECIVEILKSNDFVVVDYLAEYVKLERRTRVSWSKFVEVLRCIPLAHEGNSHTKLRRDFARLIGARSVMAKLAIEKFFADAVPMVLRAPRDVELMRELIRPATDTLFGALIGIAVPQSARGPSVSQIFDRFLSLNRRKLMQNSVAQISKVLGEGGRELTTSVDYATALLIVGHDSLLASLGQSLAAVLQAAPGKRLCDLPYPDFLPQTGVPYVERNVTKDCAIRGFEFRAGDRVRLFMDGCPARGSMGKAAPFFGKGRHLCLGQDLSQWSWRVLVKELARLRVRVRIIKTHTRKNDYVFNMCDWIEVGIHE
jgi:cytochrome P450